MRRKLLSVCGGMGEVTFNRGQRSDAKVSTRLIWKLLSMRRFGGRNLVKRLTLRRLSLYDFFFWYKRGPEAQKKENKKLNYTQIPRHSSPRNIIINESLKFTRWRLQNYRIPRIQGQAKICQPVSTSVVFPPSVNNLSMLISLKDLLNTSNQRKDGSIDLAIVSNHINKDF